MIKKLLGIKPKEETDGSLSPSKLSLKLATSDKTNYKPIAYEPYQGKRKKILIIFTEEKNMTMENGKLFSTGNHPVEALVPMLHLRAAGFEFQVATPTGKRVVFETWAFPSKDDHVKGIYNDYKSSFEKPDSIEEIVRNSTLNTASYIGVFVPGGHGAMLGIPNDKNVGSVLNWAYDNDLFIISLCHGPGSFLSTQLDKNKFIFDGYRMAVFPDSVDKQTPKIGYLPGPMPWKLNEKLEALGATIINEKSDDTVCKDRRLLTGASPLASNDLGKLAAQTLLDALK
jgi:molecular chaperone Hsp31 and glyoxalase 3